jgi:acetylglutamate kinase
MVDFGLVGDIVSVDPRLLRTLLAADFVPVIAPLGGDDGGHIFNINADTVASKIAGALAAEKLLLVTDVDGILRADGSLLSRTTAREIDALIADGVVRGGMVPKARAAVAALEEGVRSVHILSGRRRSTLLAEVFTDTGSGTMVVGDRS